ncbi:lipocalin family protein [Vibrio sagamiensis]|uniref:lipocalin family protein n=1 Tax=Vibrio sagamiensis TaxID=512650 RepID=UPI0003A2CC97|nr:lipocalin family protein [Vibrio sagamiensis]PNQ54416.1 lipocalin [Vibrio agarivorans]
MKYLRVLSCAFLTTLFGCTSVPKGVEPVKNFELQAYFGKWYEIARLDHSFERGLTQVSAEYQPQADGGIAVINRGYSNEDQQWTQAEGKAYFVDAEDVGHLKVSFFGPFYSSYIVFEQGEDYAFISGYNHDYLWLLARTPTVDSAIVERFKQVASEKGFNVDQLIFVEQR